MASRFWLISEVDGVRLQIHCNNGNVYNPVDL